MSCSRRWGKVYEFCWDIYRRGGGVADSALPSLEGKYGGDGWDGGSECLIEPWKAKAEEMGVGGRDCLIELAKAAGEAEVTEDTNHNPFVDWGDGVFVVLCLVNI